MLPPPSLVFLKIKLNKLLWHENEVIEIKGYKSMTLLYSLVLDLKKKAAGAYTKLNPYS